MQNIRLNQLQKGQKFIHPNSETFYVMGWIGEMFYYFNTISGEVIFEKDPETSVIIANMETAELGEREKKLLGQTVVELVFANI